MSDYRKDIITEVSSPRGAPMGRRALGPDPERASEKTHLFYVPFVDGCYDRGGAYWGAPANLYCAEGGVVGEIYFRADSREDAKARVKAKFPTARFYR